MAPDFHSRQRATNFRAVCRWEWLALVGSLCLSRDFAVALDPSPLLGGKAFLPDFDCRDNPWADAFFAETHEFVQQLTQTPSAACEEKEDCAVQVALEVSRPRLRHFLSHFDSEGNVISDLSAECPFAALALCAATRVACLAAVAAGRAPRHAERARCSAVRCMFGELLGSKPFGIKEETSVLLVLLNTRWMQLFRDMTDIMQVLARKSSASLDSTGLIAKAYDCPARGPENAWESGIDWNNYWEILEEDPSSTEMVNTIYALRDPFRKISECCIGFLTATLEKFLWSRSYKSELVHNFAYWVAHALVAMEDVMIRDLEAWQSDGPTDSLMLVLLTRWPVLRLLKEASTPVMSHNYRPYELDFSPQELQGSAVGGLESPAALRPLPASEHAAVVRTLRWGRWSTAFRHTLAAVEASLSRSSALAADAAGEAKVMFVSVLWGHRYVPYIGGFLRRAAAFGHGHRYLVFCLDPPMLDACAAQHPDPVLCVPGRLKTLFNKYTVISALLHLGIDAVYLDLDIILLQDPLPPILQAAASEEVELLVTRDFGGECLNTGVIYVKAHADTALFVRSLLTFLWHNPYEFSQTAFSGLVGNQKVTNDPFGEWGSLLARRPQWAILDSLNAFATSIVYHKGVEGWTGSLENMVAYHFLDGAGGVDPDFAVEGRYINLYELFFDNPRLNLSDAATPLWRQDPRIERQLLSTRLPGPPQELVPCILTDL